MDVSGRGDPVIQAGPAHRKVLDVEHSIIVPVASRDAAPSRYPNMKIVIADDLPQSAVALLQQVPGFSVSATPGRPKPELLADLADADALIVRSATKVTPEVLAAAPKLRIIARAGSGVDNVDLAAASARGIVVTNAPGGNSISVAEHALALMLSLARSVASADAAMKQQRWEKKNLLGAELREKTLGVVGFGRIGQAVAHRARAFGMKILAHDPFIAEHVGGEMDVELVSLDKLCAEADYITLHLPVTGDHQQALRRGAAGVVQEGRQVDQHGARGTDRRAGARRCPRQRTHRRRGPRRVPEGTARRLVADVVAARGRHAAHRRHRRPKRRRSSAWTSRKASATSCWRALSAMR